MIDFHFFIHQLNYYMTFIDSDIESRFAIGKDGGICFKIF